MDPLWEELVAKKEAARRADDEAIASGRKSVEQVARESYIFSGLKLGFDLKAQPPVVFGDWRDEFPDWL